ncbi:hypothetical protein [uncultured Formosa sp.]|uniref:hypothetical protein n=1 Tax=uncultured Formosa sp. TaxID=255435 RepID=UPI00261C45F9|nr:hypothetical protein [uncultured Formosa sp.]
MKTILIPTDFSEKSLQLIKNAVLHFPEESIQIVLATGYQTSILNWSTKSKLVSIIADKKFYKLLSDIKLEHGSKISNVNIDLYTGKTNEAFKAFLESNNIEDAIIPKNKLIQFPNNKCFDICDLIHSFSPNVSSVDYESDENSPPKRSKLFSLKNQFSLKKLIIIN